MTNISTFFPNYHMTQEQRIKRWAVMYEAQKEDKWLWAFTEWMNENYWIPALATVLYLLFIYFGTRYMKNRKEFNLQTPLVIWNGLLAGIFLNFNLLFSLFYQDIAFSYFLYRSTFSLE